MMKKSQPEPKGFAETYREAYEMLKDAGELVWISFADPICPVDGSVMREETSHHRCLLCGYILPCCEGAPQ